MRRVFRGRRRNVCVLDVSRGSTTKILDRKIKSMYGHDDVLGVSPESLFIAWAPRFDEPIDPAGS